MYVRGATVSSITSFLGQIVLRVTSSVGPNRDRISHVYMQTTITYLPCSIHFIVQYICVSITHVIFVYYFHMHFAFIVILDDVYAIYIVQSASAHIFTVHVYIRVNATNYLWRTQSQPVEEWNEYTDRAKLAAGLLLYGITSRFTFRRACLIQRILKI
jgi:hypothetical protein